MDNTAKNIMEHLRELCLRIGSRHVGSPGENLAAEYIASEFAAMGYRVVLEEYSTIGWECSDWSFANMCDGIFLDGALPCFFSNSVVVEDRLLPLEAADIAKLADRRVKGRLCLVNTATSVGMVGGRNAVAEELDRLGAAAAIFISDQFELPNSKIQRSLYLEKMGAAAVSAATAAYMLNNLDKTYRLCINARKFPHKSRNVVARVDGVGGKLVVGAHYDTAPFTQGASDDAAGIAAILELARRLRGKTEGIPVDFVALGAEEYITEKFPPGSGDYAERHRDEDITCFCNFDGLGTIIGTDELQLGLGEKLPAPPVTRYPVVPYTGNGDDKAFNAISVPTMWYCTKSPYRKIHTPGDSLEFIQPARISAMVDDATRVAGQIAKG